jgi:hypothetical protein
MVKKGKSRTSRNVGSTKCKKTHKQNLRAQFEARHIDQVWQDVRKADGVTDGKVGPVGTTDRFAKSAAHSFPAFTMSLLAANSLVCKYNRVRQSSFEEQRTC